MGHRRWNSDLELQAFIRTRRQRSFDGRVHNRIAITIACGVFKIEESESLILPFAILSERERGLTAVCTNKAEIADVNARVLKL